MPGRLEPLITGEIYHVFNRGIDRRTTFAGNKEYSRALELLRYYMWRRLPVRYSVFRKWSRDGQLELFQEMKQRNEKLIDVLAFCLMPNHFHLLIRQVFEGGISKYLSNFQNSYTRYFNTKNQRVGPLFLDQFKAVRIESEEQLTHVSRYIHLNPFTSYVVKSFDSLERYSWSSLPEYLENIRVEICQKETITSLFKRKGSYKTFVFDRADYQRRLSSIAHLTFEDE